MRALVVVLLTALTLLSMQQGHASSQASAGDDSESRPTLTKDDIRIVRRASQILNSPMKWNRHDTRDCPPGASTFSLYCALERASDEVGHQFEHREGAMQEARFVIDDVMANGNQYEHRLMDYNNDSETSFSDIQRFFRILETRIRERVSEGPPKHRSPKPASDVDLQIVERARTILNSPVKWDQADKTQTCPPGAATFSLFCAFKVAATKVRGTFDSEGAVILEARRVISNTAPNAGKYEVLLMDYNNDPTTTFGDMQKLLQLTEESIRKQLEHPELQILERARAILDSPGTWNRMDTQDCLPNATTFSLFCAFKAASLEVTGDFDNDGAAIQEARNVISEVAPNRSKYRARLTDYNNDPTVTFAQIQDLFQLVQQRLVEKESRAGSQ